MLAFVIGFVIGAAIGWLRAARRGGTLPDRLQYAIAHGIPLGLACLAAVLIAVRIGWLS